MNEVEFPELIAWRQLTASPEVREQQVAFTCATGIPLTLAPASTLALAEELFCVKGCMGGHSGEVCREKLLSAEARAVSQAGAVRYCCPSGLMKILVPVFTAGRHSGSLLAGPFTLSALDNEKLNRLSALLSKLALTERGEDLQKVWTFSPQLSSDKCRAAEILLQVFSKYLGAMGKQLLQPQPAQNPILPTKIQDLLTEDHESHVTLKEEAPKVTLSPCHFCSVFRKQTGRTFSRYRIRLRLERARVLLDDHGRRITEVAYESGFDSIPYFNRVFWRRFRCSPTEYRKRSRENQTL